MCSSLVSSFRKPKELGRALAKRNHRASPPLPARTSENPGRPFNTPIRNAAILLGLAIHIAVAATPIYVGTSKNGLLKSTDAGVSWQVLSVPLTNTLFDSRLSVSPEQTVSDPSNANGIYFLGKAGAQGLFNSSDGGQTWSANPIIGFQPDDDSNSLAIDAAGKAVYLIGYTNVCLLDCAVYKSVDKGVNWTRLALPNTPLSPVSQYPSGAPAFQVIADPSLPNTLYASDGFDFFQSVDAGNTWTVLSSGFGFSSQAISSLAVNPYQPSMWFALRRISLGGVLCPLTNGGQCGIFRSTDAGKSWQGVAIPTGQVYSINFSSILHTLYATANVPSVGMAILKSGDDGTTWSVLKNGLSTIQPYPVVRADPAAGTTVYTLDSGGAAGTLDVSTDGGASFVSRQIKTPGCISTQCDTGVLSMALGGTVQTAGPSPTITTGGIVPVYSASTSIQPGEWASIFGTNLAAGNATWNGDFPITLGGVSVTVNSKPAYLWFVSPTQINFQAPDDTATGAVPVTVTTPSGSFTSTVTLQHFAPSFSLLDGKHVTGIILRSDGTGAYGGGTYDIIGPTGTSLGYATKAAKTGDHIVLFAVGLGPTDPATPAPAGHAFSGAAATTSPVQISINNANVPAEFAGLSSAGLFQINLTLPAGLGAGDVALRASVGGAQTQASVLISVQ